MQETPEPFGPPAVRCTPLATVLPLRRAAPPTAVLERLRAGRPGLALLETGSRGEPDLEGARHSFVLARALLRVVLRGRRLTARALVPAGEPLLPLLRARIGGAVLDGDGLRAELPEALPVPGVPDDELLRGPCVLDALRAAAGLLGDRG